MARRRGSRAAVAAALALACTGSPAAAAGVDDLADQWLPRSTGAEWTYTWSDSAYSPTPRTERYRLQARSGTSFRLRWEEPNAGAFDVPSSGVMDFQQTDAGLINLNYQSNPPPRQYPILCASPLNCGNSLAMDLRTVLMHELGHVLGLEHATQGIMAETLRPGTCLRGGKPGAAVRRWRGLGSARWFGRHAFRRC